MYNGQIIKQLLAEKNIHNKELLSYLGTEANSSLSQIVNGNPTVKRLEKVADFFGVSMDLFFERENLSKPVHLLMGIMSNDTKKKLNYWNASLKRKIKEFVF